MERQVCLTWLQCLQLSLAPPQQRLSNLELVKSAVAAPYSIDGYRTRGIQNRASSAIAPALRADLGLNQMTIAPDFKRLRIT
jgi:hypothetical protein